MPHRFSPYSTGAIKGRNNGKKIKRKKKKTNNELLLINQLVSIGFSYENSNACIPYLEEKNINHALDFFEKWDN